MTSPELAIIIPHCGEYPHIHYTLQSLFTELHGHVDFEVILVDNTCQDPRVSPVNRTVDTDRSLDALLEGEDAGWLKRLTYSDHLSHWAAKNVAVRNTDAPFLFFLDAHCLIHPGTLRRAFAYYRENYDVLNGSLHLPISDFLKADHAKVYHLIYRPDHGLLHYTNMRIPTATRDDDDGIIRYCKPRPCASTCGALCRLEHIVGDLQYWPERLGPYGGGENYFNFVMARMGRNICIAGVEPLRHWHVPRQWSRSYTISYEDWARNVMIATYLIGGETWLYKLATSQSQLPDWHPVRQVSVPRIEDVRNEILNDSDLVRRHSSLNERAVMSIEEWATNWVV